MFINKELFRVVIADTYKIVVVQCCMRQKKIADRKFDFLIL